jgi:hypothetical protein
MLDYRSPSVGICCRKLEIWSFYSIYFSLLIWVHRIHVRPFINSAVYTPLAFFPIYVNENWRHTDTCHYRKIWLFHAPPVSWVDARHLCREPACPAHGKRKPHGKPQGDTRQNISTRQSAIKAHGKTRRTAKSAKSTRQTNTRGKLMHWSHIRGQSDGVA